MMCSTTIMVSIDVDIEEIEIALDTYTLHALIEHV